MAYVLHHVATLWDGAACKSRALAPTKATCYVGCCSMKHDFSDAYLGGDQEPNRQKLNCLKINGTRSAQVDLLGQDQGFGNTPGGNAAVLDRQNIPTEKQMVDPYRQGVIVEEEGIGYRQIVVIRSYEVGADKTTTIESILSLLQETALNHVWMSGLLSDGFGATHGMMRNNLIWVVSRMQVQVDHYPIWGEVMEIDTWVGASGKNGMRRDWLLKSKATGLVFARATSTWVMMNQQTRRLSKMPDEVRAEISPWFIDKHAIPEENTEKIEKLDNNARYVQSNLKPKRSDLDMNQHVNNVKYLRWMLETKVLIQHSPKHQIPRPIGDQQSCNLMLRGKSIPDEFLEKHQLSEITLEYRRECGSSDVVQSLCQPQEDGLIKTGIPQCNNIGVNGHSVSSEILEGNGFIGSKNKGQFSYTHLLQTKGEAKNEEIVRAKTTWKKKISTKQFHT